MPEKPTTAVMPPLGLRELLGMMNSPFEGERSAAEAAARNMGPRELDELMAYIDAEMKKYRRRKRIYHRLVAGTLAVIVPTTIYFIVMIIWASTHGRPDLTGAYGGGIGGVAGGLGGGIIGGFSWLMAPPYHLTAAARLLAEFDDVRGAGALILALRYRMNAPEVRITLTRSLMRLLPRIDESTAHVLTDEQRTALHQYVRSGQPNKETELLILMLGALEVVGNREALRSVEALRQRSEALGVGTLTGAAEKCALAIRERVERERTGQDLLRAAASPVNGADVLPRAVTSSVEADPAQLLRASNEDR